ncbi:MAG TPA: hypothetical protein DCX22_01380 [Dehalococcoidia bacterium]|nr:hypothetical protein [Dehalococcoidia bacterium]
MNQKPSLLSEAVSFLKRQQTDWKITVARTSLDRFAYQMVLPYLSLYIVALGATATQLGMVNSLGMVFAGIISLFSGFLIDRMAPKKVYLVGIGLLAIAYATYVLAQTWVITFIAMIAYWSGYSVSVQSCATICGNCLENKDRATGMMLCETVGAGLLGMAGPLAGAWLVTMFGGVTVEGIRPLFFIAVAVTVITFIMVLKWLSARKWGDSGTSGLNIIKGFKEVFNSGRYLKRWQIIAAIGQLPMGMVIPFTQVFAYEVKGADQYILGVMVTASALTSIIFSVPLGRLADRIGRKRILYATIPLFWAANIVLICAPNAGFLILSGVLQGFYYVSGPIGGAMERELVPRGYMGRWLGIGRFFKMGVSAGFAVIAGIIWDTVGPQYVFLSFVVLDLAIRMPLLITMPETLNMQFGKKQE